MKTISIISLAIAIFIFAACNSSKKVASNTAATTVNTTAKNGVYAPRNEELQAAQLRGKSVTMETLNEGYALYTGTCTKCHNAKNIYTRSEAKWPHIIDEMAPKAKLTAAQKEAVFQYVMAIKATQAL